MPIEIKELNIRVNVNRNEPEQGSTPPAGGGSQGGGGGADRDEIIAECVEQVMELLKNKMER